MRHGRQRSRNGSSISVEELHHAHMSRTSACHTRPCTSTLAIGNNRRPMADPAASDDDGEEEAMDHSESDALEAARARRGDLHRALLDLERALAGAARGRAQAWADSVRATLVRVRETFTAHIEVTEGAAGLYQEVLAQAPRLSGAVNRLQVEHA